MNITRKGQAASWKQKSADYWLRPDGAVVRYDHSVECNTARPWLPKHRGFIAYAPGKDQHNYLGFVRRNSRMKIPCKFRTAQSAMKAVDREFPFNHVVGSEPLVRERSDEANGHRISKSKS